MANPRQTNKHTHTNHFVELTTSEKRGWVGDHGKTDLKMSFWHRSDLQAVERVVRVESVGDKLDRQRFRWVHCRATILRLGLQQYGIAHRVHISMTVVAGTGRDADADADGKMCRQHCPVDVAANTEERDSYLNSTSMHCLSVHRLGTQQNHLGHALLYFLPRGTGQMKTKGSFSERQ
jgi:hypothetical protein